MMSLTVITVVCALALQAPQSGAHVQQQPVHQYQSIPAQQFQPVGQQFPAPVFNRRNAGGRAGPQRSGASGAQSSGAPAPGLRLPAPETFVNPSSAVAVAVVESHDQFFYKPGPLVFDIVITNLGGGYNPEYGVFTAPVPGIYSMNYHASSNANTNKPVHVDLLHNDVVINSGKGSGTSGTPSNSAVLYLEQFDRVSVNGRAGTAIGCEGNGFCTFNVVLVKEGKFHDNKLPRAFPMDKW